MEIGIVRPISITTEVRAAYLSYAMSVIVSRALPDARDGLKPVQRRILYGMWDMGFRSNQPYKKSARIVGDVLGKMHPHGDSAVYDALARMAQPWSMRYPLVDGQGNFGSVDGDPPAAMRYTEARLAAIAEELLIDIEKNTVAFRDNFDSSYREPTVLPALLPNLLLNGAAGIAVGMATNIPPHNLNELCDALIHLIDHPEATVEELITFLPGPDFPTAASILGTEGILAAYSTGRGQITLRAKAHIEEGNRGAFNIVVTELPYQVNKARLQERIAELAKERKIEGVRDVRDESDRAGMRLVILLKQDAQPKKVLNALYKHTQMQTSFGINMLALVEDGLQPRVLTLKRLLQEYVTHRQEVIRRRTEFDLEKARARAHILEGLKIALDNIDEIIRTIRESRTTESARNNLVMNFALSEIQATAILDMQLRRLAALERQKIIDEYDELMSRIADYNDILASEARQRTIVSEELAEVTEKFGDDRRTQFAPWDGDMSDEDLIAEDDVVVTITSGGYAKRTKLDLYRSQRRGGKGVRGAALRQDDVVEHMFVSTTHHWILFFTNKGRVYRAKAYQLPDSGRDARGQHVANLLAFQPDEEIAQVLAMPDFESSDYLVMATRKGLVKKTKLSEYDKNRQGGIIAINLTEDDELIAARQVSESDDLLLVSRKGMSARFRADDETLRPMGRATSGVIGMRFREGDSLLAMDVVQPDAYVVTITDGGFAKRTPVAEWSPKGRGILGGRAMKLVEERGSLVGALVCDATDQIFAIASNGIVIRTRVEEIRPSGRDTMGVKLMNLAEGDAIVAVARGGESDDDEGDDADGAGASADTPTQAAGDEPPVEADS